MNLRNYIPALKFGAKLHPADILGGGGSPFSTGNVYWVMATGASEYTNFQDDYNVRYTDKTESVQNDLVTAVGVCTADKGDHVVVTPGHSETVPAGDLAIDKAGITISHQGNGENAALYTFDAAGSTFTVGADDIHWYGGNFHADKLDVASAFTTGAAKNFRISEGKFEDISSVLNFLSIVTTSSTDNAADDLQVLDNYWYGLNTTPLAFVSILAAELRPIVADNKIDLAATSGGECITLADKIVKGVQFVGNVLTVVGATGTTTGIFLTGSGSTSTGVMAYNFASSLDTGTELFGTNGTGIDFFENYYVGVVDKSGKLMPVVDAA